MTNVHKSNISNHNRSFTIIIIIIIIITFNIIAACYRLYAGYLQLYTSIKSCFYSIQMLQLFCGYNILHV